MTRNEFYENTCDWEDLLTFCSENGLYSCEDVYSYSQAKDMIDDELRSNGIRGVWSLITEISDPDADFFRYGSNGFESLDNDDFCDYRDAVEEECENDIGFDEEDEEYYDEEYEEEDFESSEEDDVVDEEMLYSILAS